MSNLIALLFLAESTVILNGSQLKLSFVEDDYSELMRRQEESLKRRQEEELAKKQEESLKLNAEKKLTNKPNESSKNPVHSLMKKHGEKKFSRSFSSHSDDPTWRPHKRIKSEKKRPKPQSNPKPKPVDGPVECVILD